MQSQTGSVEMQVTRGNTGRSSVVDGDFHSVHGLTTASASDLHMSPLASRILSEVTGALPRFESFGSVFYRGRPIDDVAGGWEEMGPPGPSTSLGAGRYNRVGVAVLYLLSSDEGVRRERSGTRLCIQQYVVDGVRVADLTSNGSSRSLGRRS